MINGRSAGFQPALKKIFFLEARPSSFLVLRKDMQVSRKPF